MGISQVQTNGNLGQASSTTVTCTLSSAVTSGNLLAIFVKTNNTARNCNSATDTTGGTWVNAAEDDTTITRCWMVGVAASNQASTTITVTLSDTSGAGTDAHCYEMSSTTGWPADPRQTSSANSGTSVSNITGSNLVTSQAEELLLSGLQTSGNRLANPAAEWTEGGPAPSADTGTHSAFRVTTSSGTYNSSWSWADGATDALVLDIALTNNLPTTTRHRKPVFIQ